MTEYKVLSVRQPWATLIITGIKPIENRDWRTNYRGQILIHAGQQYDTKYAEGVDRMYGLDRDQLDYGAIIGSVDLVDIVTKHRSHFFEGPFGWVLTNPRAVKPVPMSGRVSLFTAHLPQALSPRPR